MNIAELKYFSYTGMMTRSIRSSRRLTKNRSGIILRLINTEGIYGYGEVSPLDGFSIDNLADVTDFLNKHSKNTGFIQQQMESGKLAASPSLLFGIEQAIHSIQLLEENPADHSPRETVPINYLIGSTATDETIEAASMAHALGWKTVKLKLGVKPFEAELDTIKKIQSLLPDIKLRFDLNGAWSFSEAVRCINLLSEFNVEYIEQPVDGLKPLFDLSSEVDIPVAPDEAIRSLYDAEEAVNHPNIEFIVIKPMNFGFRNTVGLIKRAESQNKKIIISTLFESTIGVHGLAYLASLTDHDSAHGIYNYLDVEELKDVPQLIIDNGEIIVNQDHADYTSLDSIFG